LLINTSPERQRDEVVKLLNTPAPGQAVRDLHRLDVLPYVLPEVAATVGVPQSMPHTLDVFDHTVVALDAWADLRRQHWAFAPKRMQMHIERLLTKPMAGNLAQVMLTPMAVLLHDVGKPLTRREQVVDGETRQRFFGHDRLGSELAGQVMARLRFGRQATEFVETIVANHMRPILLAAEGKVTRRAAYRFFRDTQGGTFQAGIATALHAVADQRAANPGARLAAETALLNTAKLLIAAYFEHHNQVIDPPVLLTGRDLIQELGVSEGKLVGVLLSRLKEAQATGQVTDRDTALDFIKADPDFANYQKSDL
jgi:tRNA nucleotidyltransferase/poly(A) polymerase